MSQSSRRIKPKQDRKIAVALSYERGGERAPVVTAKGEGHLAEDMLRLAFANDVRVREDPDLTQVLSVVEVDCEIPLEAFAAVAEILAYVYRVNGSYSDAPPLGEDEENPFKEPGQFGGIE